MNRREFLRSVSVFVAGASLTAPSAAHALLRCEQAQGGYQQCEAGIDSTALNQTVTAAGGQHYSQWCWAACIEMAFRYYGYVVTQERIVQETWGQIVDAPAYPADILRNLNRTWMDDYGKRFSSWGDSYSANPYTAVEDLSNNYPLIIGTMGHAMLLTSLSYYQDPWGGGDIVSAIVRDPAPGVGRRMLTDQEWISADFLARIRVSPV